MDSSMTLRRPFRSSGFIARFQIPKPSKTQLFRRSDQLSFNLTKRGCSNEINITPAAEFPRQIRGMQALRVRASSDDARSISSGRGSFGDGSDGLTQPSAVEFITSERVKVVAMLALALALCNADRVVMSVAIVPLSLSYGWRQSFAGIVQSSFLWGYLISPIAGGTLVDRHGGKVVMAWGVALWSLATFLTPWAAETSLWALMSMRMLLGIAEGVALPCMNNMIARWFPQTERSRAVGLAMAGFQLGSAIGLTLSPILMSQGGVFGPFVIFGLSGFLWVLVWLSATSSSPEKSRQISTYELQYIQKGKVYPVGNDKVNKSKVIPPFRQLLSKMPTWSLIIANAMHSWGFFVILSWMPIYFKTIYHVDLRHAAWFSAVPWSMMAVAGYFAGVWSDMMIQRGISVTSTRKIMQSIGFIGPGLALIGLTMAKRPTIASAWLTLAVGLKSFSHCGFLVNLQEIAPQYSGVLHGMSNTAGTFAAIFSISLLLFSTTRFQLLLQDCKLVAYRNEKGSRVRIHVNDRPCRLSNLVCERPFLLTKNTIRRGQIRNQSPSPFRAPSTQNTQSNKSAFSFIKVAAKKFTGLITGIFFSRKNKEINPNFDRVPSNIKPPGFSYSTDASGTTRSNSKSSSRSRFSHFSRDSSSFSASYFIQIGSLQTSFDEICKATGNFSPANKIGEGAFGTVYRGKLRDGSFVAVKRAKQEIYDHRLAAEYKNEVKTLSLIEHLNLVRFFGYLEHGKELIIIIEYVSNGTLREHLDGLHGDGLQMSERLDIAIDVAHAITYLHTYTDPPIIHRDIKASNILITEKFRAKVADFGFARIASDQDLGATHISTQVKGTAGYLDPEYLKTYQLTEKSDVYSFGILLVEMVSGRHPIDHQSKSSDTRVTARWALRKLKDKEVVVVMDPRLQRNPASIEAAEKVLKLARECISPLRPSRPSMKKCAEVLWEIRKEFKDISAALTASASHNSGGRRRRDLQDLYSIADSDYHRVVNSV
ncbi:OLC1v1006156C1 [Oldenlandia corymbosa var. corymbosa]|uniref:non-specific serine/threonine protein kinase n=1 Tax=Oldenlandia corymbosa var. corymbosa TaxID=529605 RepID=A0AAV1DGD5_OLDCO|nr:OLC1v1006156C1 [Oldenlandia corymbosa var. corymbosa]